MSTFSRGAVGVVLGAVVVVGAGLPLIPGQSSAARRTGLATTFTVDSTADVDDAKIGDGVCAAVGGGCTLRAAIREANAFPGTVTINLPAGTYALTIAGKGEENGATGDLDIQGTITIVGAGSSSTIVDGGGLDRVFDVAASGDATISGVTIRNGSADVGGGVRNSGTLTLQRVTVTANTATNQGGGLFNTSTGTLTIADSIVSANTATNYGGGVGNDAGGTLTVLRSLVTANTAQQGAGGVGTAGTAGLTNATIVANTVTQGSVYTNGDGGGVLVIGAGKLTLLNDTITGNTATRGAGVVAESGTTATAKNTIIASNAFEKNCGGTITSQGHNLDSSTNCGFDQAGDMKSTNPLLGSLAENVGPTPTEAPLPGSPVIDAGDNNGCPPTDARGAPRPFDGKGTGNKVCDIGAVEYGATTKLWLAVVARNG